MKDSQGQGLVELIFAVGIVVLVLGGVVGLMLKSMGARTVGYDRKKATQLAQAVMENLVQEQDTDPAGFWTLSPRNGQSLSGFDGYGYSVGFTDAVGSLGCSNDCAYVVVSIGWSGSRNPSLTFTRFFLKK